jgi:hypothetical protein
MRNKEGKRVKSSKSDDKQNLSKLSKYIAINLPTLFWEGLKYLVILRDERIVIIYAGAINAQ